MHIGQEHGVSYRLGNGPSAARENDDARPAGGVLQAIETTTHGGHMRKIRTLPARLGTTAVSAGLLASTTTTPAAASRTVPAVANSQVIKGEMDA